MSTSADRILQIVIKAKDEASSAFESAERGASSAFSGMGTAALAATAVVASAVVGVGAALDKAADTASNYASEVTTIQRLTGDSAESSSALAATFDRLGMSSDQSAKILKTLSTNITGNSAALKDMGIATTDANGNTRSSEDVLKNVADYYANATDKTTALSYVSSVLGKSYADMLPALSAGSSYFDTAAAKASDYGLILNQQALGANASYKSSLADNKMAMEGLTVQFGLAVLPIKTYVEQGLTKLLMGFMDATAGIRNTIGPAISDFMAMITNGGGVLDSFAATMQQDFNIDVTPLTNALKTAKDAAIGALGVAKDIGVWIAEHQDIIVPIAEGILVAVAAYKAWTIAVAAHKAVTTAITVAQTALNGAMDANPIGIIIIAVAALVAAIIYLYNTNETVRNAINSAISQVMAALQPVVAWITGTLMPVVSHIATAVMGALSDIWAFISPILTKIFTTVSTIVQAIWAFLQPIITTIATFISDHMANIQAVISGVLSVIEGVFDVVCGLIHGIVTGDFSQMSAGVDEIMQGLAGIISNVWAMIGDAVTQYVSGIWASITSVFGSIADAIGGFVGGIASAVGGVIDAITAPFRGLISSAADWGHNLMDMFVQGIIDRVSAITDAVSGVANTVASFLGFHSPAKQGAGADADTWMPNLTSMLASGLTAGVPKVNAALATVFASVPGTIAVATSATVAGTQSQLATSASSAGTTTINNYTIGDIVVPSDDTDMQQAIADFIAKLKQYNRMQPQGA